MIQLSLTQRLEQWFLSGVGWVSLIGRVNILYQVNSEFTNQEKTCGLLCGDKTNLRLHSESCRDQHRTENLKVLVIQSCPTLCDCSLPGPCTQWDSPGKSTGVGRHFLFQRMFLTQGWNLGLLHCRQILH